MLKNVIIIDLFIDKTSPAGSCILQEIEGIANDYHVTVLSSRFELHDKSRLVFHKIKLPSQLNLLRYLAFHYAVKIKMAYLLQKMKRETGSRRAGASNQWAIHAV